MNLPPAMVVTSSQRAMRAAGWTLGGYLDASQVNQNSLALLRCRLLFLGAFEVTFSHCGWPGAVAYWAKWPPHRIILNVVNN